MLEELAWKYITQSEIELRAMHFGLVVIGGMIGGAVTRSDAGLKRAPYFLYSALLFLALSAVQFIWLKSFDAFVGGYLWVFMAVDVVASILFGFFICKIALARSRDGFGTGGYAVLAFIPFANLVLLFKPSQDPASANARPVMGWMAGVVGVLIGIVVLGVAVSLSRYVEKATERQMAELAESNPEFATTSIEVMLQADGLASVLKIMAAEAPTPVVVDEITMLTRVEAIGDELRRTYVVSFDMPPFHESFRDEIERGICAYSAFEPLLEAGATINEVYVLGDGSALGDYRVTRESCGF